MKERYFELHNSKITEKEFNTLLGVKDMMDSPHKMPAEYLHPAVIGMHRSGATMEQIAAINKLNLTYVKHIIDRYFIQPKPTT